ncbi:MAG: tetratricopeptide repeat protein [Proteobacteria bacterium]|nr:tetratricopeptide repeat protein [Pseudomonadota bacterium]
MKTKIKWFKEVLELEPGSKVFFPLARLYYEDGDLSEARQTLMQGLDRNPDHLEARFLLVEILAGQSRQDKAAEEVGTITGMLSRYPSFWKVWAESAAPASKDAAMALTFLAANFQGAPISWSQVIEQGLDALFHSNGSTQTVQTAAGDKSASKAGPPSVAVTSDADTNLRTRTMADLLADQGDYHGALDIYEELADKCGPGDDGDLGDLIDRMRVKLKKGPGDQQEAPTSDTLGETVADFISGLTADQNDGDELDWDADEAEPREPATVEEAVAANMPGKDQLLATLEALAERLEARSAL